jgi:hypothetical protein
MARISLGTGIVTLGFGGLRSGLRRAGQCVRNPNARGEYGETDQDRYQFESHNVTSL